MKTYLILCWARKPSSLIRLTAHGRGILDPDQFIRLHQEEDIDGNDHDASAKEHFCVFHNQAERHKAKSRYIEWYHDQTGRRRTTNHLVFTERAGVLASLLPTFLCFGCDGSVWGFGTECAGAKMVCYKYTIPFLSFMETGNGARWEFRGDIRH